MSKEMIGVQRYVGVEPLVGNYYVAQCTRCDWIGSSAELTGEAECTRHAGSGLCLGHTEEVDASHLLGIIQAMFMQAAHHQAEPVAWGAFYFGGKRNGQLYNHCQTEEEIDRYIQQVERSNDSISLVKDRLYTRPVEQSVPVGFQLVPINPTEDMIVAFAEAWYSKRQAIDDPEMLDAYRDMLAVAPAP